MKCSEILPPFKCYQVSVRLKSGMTGRTLVFAENPAFARALAVSLYGNKNLISVVVSEDANESQISAKPTDPAKQRIQSYRDQAKRYRDLAKSEQARQKIQKANKTLRDINGASGNATRPLRQ